MRREWCGWVMGKDGEEWGVVGRSGAWSGNMRMVGASEMVGINSDEDIGRWRYREGSEG